MPSSHHFIVTEAERHQVLAAPEVQCPQNTATYSWANCRFRCRIAAVYRAQKLLLTRQTGILPPEAREYAVSDKKARVDISRSTCNLRQTSPSATGNTVHTSSCTRQSWSGRGRSCPASPANEGSPRAGAGGALPKTSSNRMESQLFCARIRTKPGLGSGSRRCRSPQTTVGRTGRRPNIHLPRALYTIRPTSCLWMLCRTYI